MASAPQLIGGVDANGNVIAYTIGATGALATTPGTPTGTYPSAPTNVPAATGETAILAANPNRKNVIIANDGTGKMYILFDQSGSGVVSATNFTYVLPPGGVFEMVPLPLFLGRIRAAWSIVGGTAAVTEST